MDILRAGSRGHKVQLLQRLINKANAKDKVPHTQIGGKPLVEDGVFGPRTADAVSAFKSRKLLQPNDPVAGSGTWMKLGLVAEQEHNITLIGQPTSMSCWAAAAMMIAGNQSVGPGGAALASGGLVPTVDNQGLFAKSMGWRILNHSPSMDELIDLVVKSPVWISAGGSNFAHAVVLSGVYSDREASGSGTMFRIHDPWPVGAGRIYGSFANPITMLDAAGTARVPASLISVIVPR